MQQPHRPRVLWLPCAYGDPQARGPVDDQERVAAHGGEGDHAGRGPTADEAGDPRLEGHFEAVHADGAKEGDREEEEGAAAEKDETAGQLLSGPGERRLVQVQVLHRSGQRLGRPEFLEIPRQDPCEENEQAGDREDDQGDLEGQAGLGAEDRRPVLPDRLCVHLPQGHGGHPELHRDGGLRLCLLAQKVLVRRGLRALLEDPDGRSDGGGVPGATGPPKVDRETHGHAGPRFEQEGDRVHR